MKVFGADEVRAVLSMPKLIDRLEQAFREQYTLPDRQISALPGGGGQRLFVCMCAFSREGSAAVKLASVFPDNEVRGLPSIHATVVIFSNEGAPIAMLDGMAITHLRTAGASALASRYLSRENSEHLVIIGTGALAPTMAEAHCSVRPITKVRVWGRRSDRAARTVAEISHRLGARVDVSVSTSVDVDVAAADVICCCTSSPTPVLAGRWLSPGAFVDLVGSFSPSTREADDVAVARARIFVDTRQGALSEAGDLLDPIARGVIRPESIRGEMSDLVTGRAFGRTTDEEITLFKSVGTAVEDFAAADLVLKESNRRK